MRRCAVVAPAVLAAAVRLVVGAGECVLHEDRGDHTFARAKNCEEAVLDGELARFCAHAPSGGDDAIAYAHRALAKHRFRLPHRDRFPDLLERLGLNGTAVEIGVREGHWSRHFLRNWRGSAYHGVDPLLLSADLERYRTTLPEVHKFGVETIAALEADPRWHFHHGLDHQFVDAFADGSLDFVYIDSAHNYRDAPRRIQPRLSSGDATRDWTRVLSWTIRVVAAAAASLRPSSVTAQAT